MRKIELRAKKEVVTEENKRYLDNGWVYTDSIFDNDDGLFVIPYGASAECYYKRPYDFRANSDCYEVMVAKVNPKTLGQYTGLIDKNNRKIYEGDIVEFETEINIYDESGIKPYWKDVIARDCAIGSGKYFRRKDQAIVQWNSKEGMWDLKVYNNGRYKRKSKLFTYRESDYNVIGNIYDNPELLEKE